MPKPRTSLLVGFLAALVLACVATLTMYAMQQQPAGAAGTDACNCTGGNVTGGMAVIHCTCGPANCIAVRSTAAPGNVSTSCVK
jgi:hypothetical protein